MADATRVIEALTRQLAELIKQATIAQVEVEELRAQLAALRAEKEDS